MPNSKKYSDFIFTLKWIWKTKWSMHRSQISSNSHNWITSTKFNSISIKLNCNTEFRYLIDLLTAFIFLSLLYVYNIQFGSILSSKMYIHILLCPCFLLRKFFFAFFFLFFLSCVVAWTDNPWLCFQFKTKNCELDSDKWKQQQQQQ